MKILLATHQYFPDHVGGTEVLTLGIARRLHKLNHVVAVVTYIESASSKTRNFIIKETVFEEIPVYQIYYNLNADPFPVLAEYRNSYIHDLFVNILKEFNPDLVHFTHVMKLSGSTLEACSELKIPFIVHLTDFWFICPRHTLMKWNNTLCNGPKNDTYCIKCLHHTHGFFSSFVSRINSFALSKMVTGGIPTEKADKKSFRKNIDALALRNKYLREQLGKADQLIALSEFQKKMFLLNGYPENLIKVIPHGIEELIKDIIHKKPEGTQINLLLIGSVVPHKGVHVAIQAMAGSLNKNIKLIIWGDATGNNAYSLMIRGAAKTDPRVELRGIFAPDQMADVLSECHMLLMPALWYENDPLVVQLALAAGMPVMASHLGSLPDMIRDQENGWLLPPGNVRSWTKAFDNITYEKLNSLKAFPSVIRTADDHFKDVYSIYQKISQ
ncbi:MAG: glycosyltransferase [Bacteroidales bacterium]